jgi:hypothetical protein
MAKSKAKEQECHQLEDIQFVTPTVPISAIIGNGSYQVIFFAVCTRRPIVGGLAVGIDRESVGRDIIPVVYHHPTKEIVWADTLGVCLTDIRYEVIGRL